MKKSTICRVLFAALVATVPGLMAHNVGGPDPKLTGAPGESDCTSCHGGGTFKAAIQASFSGDGSTYAPGVKQTISLSFSNATAKLYGFQLSAHLSSDNTQGGDFVTPTTTGVQVLCANGSTKAAGKTCTSNMVQYIEHNRANSTGVWSFDWTPPATAAGPIKFYLVGNAANGDNNTTGDTISKAVYTLTAGSGSVTKPSISSNGVVTTFNERVGAVASGWLEIHGKDLITGAARDWTADDFANGTPTALDGISVSVNGQPAFVRHISATEIDVQSPTDSATGPVQVIVTSGKTASDPFIVQKQAVLPAMAAPFKGKTNTYVLAVLNDGLYAAPAATVTGIKTRPVVAGELVTFYGTGFGAVATFADGSDIPAGTITALANSLANPVTIQIGSVAVPAANILYQGLALDSIGLYQFTVVLPSNLASGDLPITFSAGGVDTAQTIFLTVKAATDPSTDEGQ